MSIFSYFRVDLVFRESLLATCPNNAELYSQYIIHKNAELVGDPNEVETLPDAQETIDQNSTVFHRMPDETPCLVNYQIKGFFKDAAGSLRRAPGTLSSQMRSYRSVISGSVFVFPRYIPIIGGPLGIMERPLRAQTMQGERVALARSETLPAGSTLTYYLQVLGVPIAKSKVEWCEVIHEWLEYGRLRGLGQWRNADWGSFRYTFTAVDELPVEVTGS